VQTRKDLLQAHRLMTQRAADVGVQACHAERQRDQAQHDQQVEDVGRARPERRGSVIGQPEPGRHRDPGAQHQGQQGSHDHGGL
jgi:hypothetical protein